MHNLKNTFKKDDILLFQYFFGTNISCGDILYMKNKYQLKLVIPIHDFYFLGQTHDEFYIPGEYVHSNFSSNKPIKSDIVTLLKSADPVIFPSIFIKTAFDKKIELKNAVVSRHIDYKIVDFLRIPKIEKHINIAIINNINICKGQNLYPDIFKSNKYKGIDVKYHVYGENNINWPNLVYHGPYLEGNIFSLLQNR